MALRRLFFAVLLSEEAIQAVLETQRILRASAGERGLSWVKPEQFHYTVKFLGDNRDDEIPPALEAARQVAKATAPFSLTLAGVGAFPEKRRPQILWIGASEGVPLLTALAELLDSRLTTQGFAPEARRFKAHLTLARAKTPEGQEMLAKTLAAEAAALQTVDKVGIISVVSFTLMQSDLHPDGAIYTPLETFPLTGGSDAL